MPVRLRPIWRCPYRRGGFVVAVMGVVFVVLPVSLGGETMSKRTDEDVPMTGRIGRVFVSGVAL